MYTKEKNNVNYCWLYQASLPQYLIYEKPQQNDFALLEMVFHSPQIQQEPIINQKIHLIGKSFP